MRFYSALILLLCAAFAFAQTEDPEVTRAKAAIDKLRGLVEAGAAPRTQLEKAEQGLADAEDFAILRKTIYGQDLNEAQIDEMAAAAARRFERRKAAFDEARKLIDAGVAPELSLGTFLEELDSARKECDLAAKRAQVVRELAESAKAEESLALALGQDPAEAHKDAERYDGDGQFTPGTFARIRMAFERRFGEPLPVSAAGETAVHRSLGFDHRGRVDVAVHPDTPEGSWLRDYLVAHHVPYFAFRQAVPGKATGAHIHLGPMSTHVGTGGSHVESGG